ncbi:invasion associated locus B family protein [Candidatus Tokpelaia sp.]|uniref:invasion associated locus B family protein n=1 Tax=Candidatus Tokpelaia sp. TaxID=2233777 RepID=UPI001238C58A|nr:invasion associated locus B family protein [Candidatus Tokpelaia sp.]KAA6404995.1 invasion associated locus B family protein [Candidatus Tokpelaia sp.]
MAQNGFFAGKRKFFGGILAAVFLPLAVLPAAHAQEMTEGWRKVCNKQQDIDVCNTVNNVLSDTGQPLTILNIIEVSGKQNQRRFAIQVPTGRVIPEGIKVSIDGAAPKTVPYMICNGPACIADMILDETLLSAMKKGKRLTVTSVNVQGYPNPINVSLQGFGQVYAGPGMTDKAFQEDQDKVQKALQLRQKELEDNMKAAQEKAKTVP